MMKQLLHLVLGGRVKNTKSTEFENINDIDIVGVFPNYAEALKAWRGKAQSTVDDARMRYFVVHLHRLMEPEEGHDHDH
jgi:hypothetical protein